MADFDQVQTELDAFLDAQFTQPTSSDDETQPQEDDKLVQEYLTGDEPEEVTPQGLNTPATEQPPTHTPQAQPTPSDAERIIALERELAATRAREQMYQSALTASQTDSTQQPQTKQEFKPFADDELVVSDEHKNLYHDADPYIASIARNVANELYQRTVVPLQQELYNVQSKLQAQQDFNVQQTSFSQYTQLKNMYPDFDQMMNSREWNSFLHQDDIYGTGSKMIDYVQQGIRTNNIRQLAGIINQFKQHQQKGQPQPQQVAPGRAQTTLPDTTQPRSGKNLKMSDFERATANFQAGRISYDVYQRVTDEFNAAMLEGRVNLNK